jgi:hypothetical protein
MDSISRLSYLERKVYIVFLYFRWMFSPEENIQRGLSLQLIPVRIG